MPTKATAKVTEKAVKGDEAEEVVLKYLKQVNRPYAATDISANLKNKVTKTNAQKVLGTLADKGLLSVKTYGKQSIYVFNQANLETLPVEELADIDNDIKAVADDLDAVKKKLKNVGNAAASMIAQPKTEHIPATLKRTETENDAMLAALAPLRKAATGGGAEHDNDGQAGPMSKAEIESIEKEWQKWRKEWVNRRKNYLALLDGVQTDATPTERLEFQEESGIDTETPEMLELEASDLCKPAAAKKLMLASGAFGIKTASISPKAIVASPGDKRKRS